MNISMGSAAQLAELIRFQQRNRIPPEVTVENMTDMLVEQSRSRLRVQLWEFEHEDFDDVVAKTLLRLVWEVNTSMKMRHIRFRASRLLNPPETRPPSFQHPKIINGAEKFASSLTE